MLPSQSKEVSASKAHPGPIKGSKRQAVDGQAAAGSSKQQWTGGKRQTGGRQWTLERQAACSDSGRLSSVRHAKRRMSSPSGRRQAASSAGGEQQNVRQQAAGGRRHKLAQGEEEWYRGRNKIAQNRIYRFGFSCVVYGKNNFNSFVSLSLSLYKRVTGRGGGGFLLF